MGEGNVRFTTRFAAIAVLLCAAGCSGGGHGGGNNSGGQSVAPTTSGNGSPPVTTVTPPTVAPVTTPAVVAHGTALLASALQSQVSVVELATGTTTATIPVGSLPSSVAVNGNYAYVADAGSQDVECIDLLTNTVAYTMSATGAGVTNLPVVGATIDPLLAPLVRPTGIAVTPNGIKAFTANLITVTSYDVQFGKKPLNSIVGINPALATAGQGGVLSFLAAITANPTTFLSQPLEGLGQARVACSNQTAFVTNTVTNNVQLISATDDHVIGYTTVGTLPIGVAAAAGKAYVACAMSQDIWVIDEATGTVKTHFAGGQVPTDVTASPSGDKIYVANFLGGDITVIDTVTDLPVNVLPAGTSISNIFTQLGITIPPASSGGISGLITTFLGGLTSTSGSTGLSGLLSGTGPSSPSTLMSGLFSSFLSFAGINQTALAGLNMPGIGVAGLSVTADGLTVCSANLLFGLTLTDIASATASAPQLLSGAGMGSTAVAAY
jgi:DNA-binding beta-propeller fold protein YncE